MQLPQVTPRAATHTANSEHVVFADNTENDHEERREPGAINYALFSQHSSCCVSQAFHFLYTFQALANFFSSLNLIWQELCCQSPECSLCCRMAYVSSAMCSLVTQQRAESHIIQNNTCQTADI